MTSAPDERRPTGGAEEIEQAESTEEVRSADSGEVTEAASEQAVADDLDRLLEDTRRERDEYLELARRAKADFENFRKRAARESSDAERRGRAALARELLPAIDNLERALKSSPSEGGEEALSRGVALVLDQLQETLSRAGVKAYDPIGERFDPAWHEALHTRSVEDSDAGIVVETLERGYRLDGQVLRPARVVVSE